MSAGAWMMLLSIVLAIGALAVVVMSLVRSIQNEKTKGRSLWREFGLGLVLMLLFFTTWVAHAISEWQVFTDEQMSHGETPKIGDFISEFTQSTLENWQSEFLQLFAFVVLAALYIHKGSAESKDGEENITASLRRIEERLGTTPATSPTGEERWRLPETPLEVQDEELQDETKNATGERPASRR